MNNKFATGIVGCAAVGTLFLGAGGASASNISGNPTPAPNSSSSASSSAPVKGTSAYGGSVDAHGNYTPNSNTGVKSQYNGSCPVLSGDPLLWGQTDPRTGAVDCTYYSGLTLSF